MSDAVLHILLKQKTDDGQASVITLEGVGGIVSTVDTMPGMEGWGPGKNPTPACILFGSDRTLILALATAMHAAKSRVGPGGFMAAFKIAEGMESTAHLTLDDFGKWQDSHG